MEINEVKRRYKCGFEGVVRSALKNRKEVVNIKRGEGLKLK